MDARRLLLRAAQSGGLFTRADALACGYSAKQIRRRLATGEWCRIAGPVMAHAGVALTPRLRDRAVQLAVPGSVLAGPSAARALRMPIQDEGSYVLIGRKQRTRVAAARVIHGKLHAHDLGTADGLRVTWYDRTIFDCLRLLPKAQALDLLDQALQRQWITIDRLADQLHRNAGMRGTTRVLALLRRVVSGARSAAERRLIVHLKAARITGWRANAPIRDAAGLIGVGDVVFPEGRLVVEVDGFAYHSTPDRFQRDRTRQNRLITAGWTVLRFTWRDLVDRPGYVTAMIRRALAAPR